MNTVKQRILHCCRSNRLGWVIFIALSAATGLILLLPQGAMSLPLIKPGFSTSTAVQILVKPSQTKLVQGSDQTVYLDVVLSVPALSKDVEPKATDMLIVLDRSGSMTGPEKMPYAKAAIRDVLSRLNEQDRFAFISFSDNAFVHSPFVKVDSSNRESLTHQVNDIIADGGTNMGDGLMKALDLVSRNDNERVRKVLLLSDGQANQGIVHPDALARLASQLARYGTVLSTIGMGLDFNEIVMTQLADHGMGNYVFLEDLSGLSRFLSEDVKETRQIYANSSALEIKPEEGVRVLDAGGYPLSQSDSGVITISTGQLLAGVNKHFVVTMTVPAEKIGSFSLGKVRLDYQQLDQSYFAVVKESALQMAVLAPEKRQEAKRSIDNAVYQQSWLKNNLGLMQKKLSHYVKEGNQDKAEKTINEYRQALQQAEEESNQPLTSPAIIGKLDAMKAEVDEVFAGGRADQDVKRKRAAKTIQLGAINDQRAH